MLLKFIKNYFEGREQRVVIGGHESGSRSLVCQLRSSPRIHIRPLLFILFINDMDKLSQSVQGHRLHCTKIWRKIVSYMDHIILQIDISALLEWSRVNKMIFHPDKCKIIKATLQMEKCMVKFPYYLEDKCLDYASVEKDLGVKLVP